MFLKHSRIDHILNFLFSVHTSQAEGVHYIVSFVYPHSPRQQAMLHEYKGLIYITIFKITNYFHLIHYTPF